MVELRDVFGISASVDSSSYVDRGGLDKRFERTLAADRHIAVHGGSKQGKSWLRTKGLRDSPTIVIQCTPTSTSESLLREALGRIGVAATLTVNQGREIQGEIDFTGNAELGFWAAKAKAEAKAGGSISSEQSKELSPIGQTSADLAWVVQTLVASKKRLVFEDFHYVDESVQKQLAFMIKAMGEYGLYLIIIGVWAKDHLLSYYNGDLEGRVEDIHLQWKDAELRKVLQQGAEALRVEFSEDLQNALVTEAYGNVGLLQRLAEQVCLHEDVLETQSRFVPRKVVNTDHLQLAKTEVASQMEGRFETFSDNFVRGMRRLSDSSRLEVYRHLLQAFTEASDDELIKGMDSAVLLQRINKHRTGGGIRASDLTQALDRVDRLQSKIDINHPVITYTKSNRKLTLADRSFLFYRSNGSPRWPWEEEQAISNDLAGDDPLDLQFEDLSDSTSP